MPLHYSWCIFCVLNWKSALVCWKWLFAAHLPMTLLVVAATGHHWWLDGIVALGLLAIAVAIDGGVRQAWKRWRPADRGTVPRPRGVRVRT